MPHKTIIRLSGVARNPANGFPAKPLVDLCFPTSQNQRRISRDLLPRAIRTLQSLEEAKELQIRGGKGRWQVLPPTPRTRAELE